MFHNRHKRKTPCRTKNFRTTKKSIHILPDLAIVTEIPFSAGIHATTRPKSLYLVININ